MRALFFLSLSILFPMQVVLAQEGVHPAPRHGHSSLHASATPQSSPEVRVTVVNATCVPFLSLSVAGTNLPAAYPCFPQGEWTANAPLKKTEIHYLVRTSTGAPVADRVLHFKPVSAQTILMTGDMTTTNDPEKLPQLGVSPPQPNKPLAPNFQFHLFPSEIGCADPCHYRVFNGMPSKLLILKSVPDGNKPSRQLALLSPGNSALFVRQPGYVEWEAEIDGKTYPVDITQEGSVRNCLIPFFLREGRPEFLRVFEEP